MVGVVTPGGPTLTIPGQCPSFLSEVLIRGGLFLKRSIFDRVPIPTSAGVLPERTHLDPDQDRDRPWGGGMSYRNLSVHQHDTPLTLNPVSSIRDKSTRDPCEIVLCGLLMLR